MKKIFILSIILTFNIVQQLNAQHTFVVTSPNDPANPFDTQSGELRWCIEQANLIPGADTIVFDIPSEYTIPVVIKIESYLPPINEMIYIEGNTQPAYGYTGYDPKIQIRGDKLHGGDGIGLYLKRCNSNVIKNIELNSFSMAYIFVDSSSNNLISDNVFYSDIENFNVSNSWGGIFFHNNSDRSEVFNNYFGTNKLLKTLSYPSFWSAVMFYSNLIISEFEPDKNIIGGLDITKRNYFYNTHDYAVYVLNGAQNTISGNLFVNNFGNIILENTLFEVCGGNNCNPAPQIIQALIYNDGKTKIAGTASNQKIVEIYLTDDRNINANKFLGVADVKSNLYWELTTTELNIGDRVIATATDKLGNTSPFNHDTTIVEIFTERPLCPIFDFYYPDTICAGEKVYYEPHTFSCSAQPHYVWHFGDGAIATTNSAHTFYDAGTYNITLSVEQVTGIESNKITKQITVYECPEFDCARQEILDY